LNVRSVEIVTGLELLGIHQSLTLPGLGPAIVTIGAADV
jgi:hypothetical protein